MKVPSDRQILRAIYDAYYDEFSSFEKSNPTRQTKILVPIDCKKIGKILNVDSDIIFGRLYYHFEKEYSYKKDNARVHFFANSAGEEIHCINFPYMAAVLGKLEDEHYKFRTATLVSCVALLVSVVSLLVSTLYGKS